MNVSPDAVQLGPLVLAWDRLALVLAFATWLGMSHFRHAGTAALVTLITARLAGALPHWADLAPTLHERVLTVLDLRVGTWFWPAGIATGVVYLLVRLRQWPSALTRSLLLTTAAVALPLLFRPAPEATLRADHVTLTQVASQGQVTPVDFGRLPRPVVVNVWATWCGPCRAELPVLARALQAGESILLINGGERPDEVRAFLDRLGVPAVTFIDDGALRRALQVSGYPSTFVINQTGQVTARHLGPVDSVQLQALLRHAKDPRP